MKWDELEAIAKEEVETLKRSLPQEIGTHAQELPVVWMARPTRKIVREDGLDPDLLGLFVGPNCTEGLEGADPLPPEIILFLENLWEFSEADEVVFREEVRVTYLHELGHYLGLEEGELEQRGLE